MRKLLISLLSLVCMMLCLASCKPSLPSGVLSKGKMTDILYDYHLALGMAQKDGDYNKSLAYREAVLKKYDVTTEEFDSSMVYYMRHTELLHDVYKDLRDRLNNQLVALGGTGSAGGEFDNLSATGDTANVWKLQTSMVFSTFKPFNQTSFVIQADTTYHKGDCLRLDFEAQFIYQDGIRDGIALLAVEFQNDSVAQQVVHVQSSQHYSVEISDTQRLGIKSVKGYFLLSDGGFSSDMGSQTTLKLMFIDHVKLIRMHAKKAEAAKSAETTDSLKVDSLRRPALPAHAPQVDGELKPSLPNEAQPLPEQTLPFKKSDRIPLRKVDKADLKPMKLTR